MFISSINSNKNFYQNSAKPINGLTFTGVRRCDFSKELDVVLDKHRVSKKESVKLTSMFNEFLAKHLNTVDGFLGSGFQGRVYNIDNKYALKLPYTEVCHFVFEKIPKRKFAGLKTYYGEPVAKFCDASVLKNVSSSGHHIQVGIPSGMLMRSADDERKFYYEKIYLPQFAAVPQRAFDALAKDFNTLNKMGHRGNNYTFDFQNPNNFVLVGSTLRITDEISTTSIKNPNSMAEMLSLFLSKMSKDSFYPYSKEAEAPRKELFKKIILAGMKHNLEIGTCSYDRILWQDAVEDLCKLKVSGDGVISTLKAMQKLIPDRKIRLKLTEDYLNTICKD